MGQTSNEEEKVEKAVCRRHRGSCSGTHGALAIGPGKELEWLGKKWLGQKDVCKLTPESQKWLRKCLEAQNPEVDLQSRV